MLQVPSQQVLTELLQRQVPPSAVLVKISESFLPICAALASADLDFDTLSIARMCKSRKISPLVVSEHDTPRLGVLVLRVDGQELQTTCYESD